MYYVTTWKECDGMWLLETLLTKNLRVFEMSFFLDMGSNESDGKSGEEDELEEREEEHE